MSETISPGDSSVDSSVDSIGHSRKVHFFGTCLIDSFFPGVGLDAMQLIRQTGAAVSFPTAQTCCGQPAWNAGFAREARSVAREQIRAFAEPLPIVVPSASCASMMKHEYPRLFQGDTLAQEAQAFAERVIELSDYLVAAGALAWTDQGAPCRIAVHHSCSAQRSMHSHRAADQLLGKLQKVTRLSHPRASECCGFGGTFAVKVPALSAAMSRDKCASLQSTGADTLVIGDSGCAMNISGTLNHRTESSASGRKGSASPPEVLHLYQFLRQRFWPQQVNPL